MVPEMMISTCICKMSKELSRNRTLPFYSYREARQALVEHQTLGEHLGTHPPTMTKSRRTSRVVYVQ